MSSDEKLLKDIIASVPVALHRNFKANLDEAMTMTAKRAADAGYTHHQFSMALFPEADVAFVDAAEAAELVVHRRATVPKGGVYSICEAGPFLIHRFTGPYRCALPRRRTAYLPPLLANNVSVDTQGSLLSLGQSGTKMFASYVTVPDYKGNTWSHVGFGLIAPGGDRWIDYWSLDSLLAAYAPIEDVPDQVDSVVPDHAVPVLKQKK
jgi:hypothetical protein